MKGKFVLAQTASVGDPAVNLKKAEELAGKAWEAFQPDVLVFPEMFMSFFPWGTDRDTVRSTAQPLEGPFAARMRELAKRYGMWIVFGMNEASADPADRRARNTIVMADDRGELAAVYRKTHLYDAFGYRESDLIRPGDRLFDPIETPFGRIGLFTCYEVRFPEVARDQRRKGADIVLMPAAWAAGALKSLHFRTLVTARALENGVYVLACDQCGADTVGESLAVDPMGVTIAGAGEGETLILASTDTERVREVRRKAASFDQRRPDLYRAEGL
ncbi:MAG: carbon-nitrogen hydrolase family protein [Oscillospiraceae bacterium]|nr:carbon-nitrogen hydrolase family protein [Oscillospiraceae bacterium]